MSAVTNLGDSYMAVKMQRYPLDSPICRSQQELRSLLLDKYQGDLRKLGLIRLPELPRRTQAMPQLHDTVRKLGLIRLPELPRRTQAMPQLHDTVRKLGLIRLPELSRQTQAMPQLWRERLNPSPIKPLEKPVLPPMVPGVYGRGPSTAISRRRDYFQDQEIGLPSVNRLPVDPRVAAGIEARLTEAQANLAAGSYLSAIILWGSVLEAVLLGAANNDKEKFNRASASPKGANGKVKRFHEWSLSDLINVAHEVNLIGLDVKKFAHLLRDFRNYIHLHQQVAEGFTPDKHTANICLQVLKAALAGIAGER